MRRCASPARSHILPEPACDQPFCNHLPCNHLPCHRQPFNHLPAATPPHPPHHVHSLPPQTGLPHLARSTLLWEGTIKSQRVSHVTGKHILNTNLSQSNIKVQRSDGACYSCSMCSLGVPHLFCAPLLAAARGISHQCHPCPSLSRQDHPSHK